MLARGWLAFAFFVASASPASLSSKQELIESNRVPTGPACARLPLYWDFEEKRWDDHILAPKGYDRGACPPGCVPNSFAPITLLILEENGRIKITRFSDGIIVDCKQSLM